VTANAFKEEHSLAIAEDEVRVVVRQPSYRAGERNPACALVFGEVSDGCLVRIHSRCLYGDVFGSQECDCAGQLHMAIEMIRNEGSGVLIYLDQEGRGAGLFAKARAYRMRQELGVDTFRSYEHYGLEPDPRSYGIAADLLGDLGLEHIRLLTNNWQKISSIEGRGIKVEPVPLLASVSDRAQAYMESKKAYMESLRAKQQKLDAQVHQGL
jgi:GTP cyclohydrolase II